MSDIQIIAQTLFEPGDIIELRFILKGKPVLKRWTTAQDLPDMADELDALNRQGYNIYFGPNPRQATGTSGDENVKLARCLFCDFDGIDPGGGCGRFEFVYTDIFGAGLPEPTLAVHSGHGVHVYWRLDEPMYDMNLWRSMQSQINARLGADRTIKNPERIMRLPGFLNTKREPYQETFICWGVSDVHS